MHFDEETGEVGEVVEVVQTHVSIEWKITDFFSLSGEVNNSYYSPEFNFADSSWFLTLYPNGETEDSSSGWVSLYLERNDSESPQTMYYTFGIKCSDRLYEKPYITYEFSKNGEAVGYNKFLSRSKLRKQKSIFMPNDMLTITCNLRCDAPSAVKGEKKLGKSLLSVLESGDDSDVVIKVQGKEIPAHRVILRARSPVFQSMFTHDMLEKQSNVVTIEDCDPETFSDFLVHIYSGSCENISMKNVFSLYTAADKYDFGELKEACTEFMKKNLTVACICDIVTLAVKHNEKELIEWATKFFCDNSLEIVKTIEWQNFLVENVTVGNELIIKALSK